METALNQRDQAIKTMCRRLHPNTTITPANPQQRHLRTSGQQVELYHSTCKCHCRYSTASHVIYSYEDRPSHGCQLCDRGSEAEKAFAAALVEFNVHKKTKIYYNLWTRFRGKCRSVDFSLFDDTVRVEIDGRQHFKLVPLFNHPGNGFLEQKARDIQQNVDVLIHEGPCKILLRTSFTDGTALRAVIAGLMKIVDAAEDSNLNTLILVGKKTEYEPMGVATCARLLTMGIPHHTEAIENEDDDTDMWVFVACA